MKENMILSMKNASYNEIEEMENNKEYYAFISYSHKDEEWARWLQHEFEHYHLPTTLNGLTDLPDNFRPIFRDIDELSGGELKPQISHALKSSSYLVIICSPNSAKSSYVDGEIREFIEIGNQCGVDNIGNIFPFIIEGIPHSIEEPKKECFPKALRDLPSELIAGDVTKHGREQAFVKILAGTLHHSNVRFSMLWNQFERDRIEAERKERERRDKLLLLESRYLSEKALDIASVDSRLARLLVLRALPKDLNDPEDRPYCIEAESALRIICNYKSAVFIDVNCFKLDSTCDRGVSGSSDGLVRLWNIETASQVGEPLHGHTDSVMEVSYSHDGKIIASCSMDGSIIMWNAENGKQARTIKSGKEHVKRVVFTSDDNLLVAMSYDHSHENYTIGIWSVENGQLVREIPIHCSNDIAIDKEDRWIAIATSGTSIEVYELKEGKKIKEIPKAHTECLSTIDFSPDGKKLVSATFWGDFIIRDWISGEILFSKKVNDVQMYQLPIINCARFSNDGNYIVTASSDSAIKIWNANTGDQVGEPLVGHDKSVLFASFSQNGKCVVSTSLDGSARIWDFNPKAPYKTVGRARYIPFEPDNNKSALSPDGRLRIELSPTELKIWNISNNRQLGPKLTCFDNFHQVMFLKSGRGIIAETENDYDIIFDWLPLQELIDKTQEQVKDRKFTEEEKKRYYLD